MQYFLRFASKLIFLFCFSVNVFSQTPSEPATESQLPIAVISTSKGDITVELYPDKAPLAVANFIQYANDGFYEGTLFHRVIKRFMVQGGGMTLDTNGMLLEKPTNPPIANESKNGLHNDRWTIAMARTDDPDSATSQFYINAKNNASLDPQQGRPGYTVFGKVIEGQYAVAAIEKVATHTGSQKDARDFLIEHENVPIEPVTILSVTIQ